MPLLSKARSESDFADLGIHYESQFRAVWYNTTERARCRRTCLNSQALTSERIAAWPLGAEARVRTCPDHVPANVGFLGRRGASFRCRDREHVLFTIGLAVASAATMKPAAAKLRANPDISHDQS